MLSRRCGVADSERIIGTHAEMSRLFCSLRRDWNRARDFHRNRRASALTLHYSRRRLADIVCRCPHPALDAQTLARNLNRDMKIPFTGGCACGAIRYECTVEPTSMFKCHCRDCQRDGRHFYMRGDCAGRFIQICARHATLPIHAERGDRSAQAWFLCRVRLAIDRWRKSGRHNGNRQDQRRKLG